ncbi:hypothetical protein M9H77_12620 [Catharanthus roseus]|uniref:Uncharacterized protein n=1 Tax=Catharanthus roseus TaxID=4058 RepID=A0ACC0BHW0_CATRO|nr:hypothetical protein M9H77_12620 [Catharanthus roseus]
MEYNWSNPSWKMMEAKSKQEDYQSKFARNMHNFHYGGASGVNAYSGNNLGNGNFTPKIHNGIGNFSSYAKSYGHTSYDDYGVLIEKQESEKEELREKEIVAFEKCEKVNFYTNETNSFFASELLCVQNFEDSGKDEGGKLAYKSIKTINFLSSNSYLSFEIYLKEIKLFSLVFMENGYQSHLLNSLRTLLGMKEFIEFNSNPCVIPRVDEYHFNYC